MQIVIILIFLGITKHIFALGLQEHVETIDVDEDYHLIRMLVDVF